MRQLSRKEKKILKKAPWVSSYQKGVKTSYKYPKGSLVDFLVLTAKKYSNEKAYSYYGRVCTFQRLIDKIEEAARALKQQGVKENDVVTICSPNTPEAVIMFYAVNAVGGICNMVHPLASEKEIEFSLNNRESKVILIIDLAYNKLMKIIDNTRVETIITMSVSNEMKPVKTALYWVFMGRKNKMIKDDRMLSWREFIDLGYCYKGRFKAKRTANDPAAIMYSGGTTGNPKGILLSNGSMNAMAVQSFVMCDPAKPGISVLSIMPIFHGLGLSVCIHTPLVSGMNIILVPSFKPKELVTLIKNNKPNFICCVPSLYEALLKSDKLGRNDLECVKCAISGGDVLSLELKNKIDRFLRNHGSSSKVRVGYGLTEGTGASCLTPTNDFREGSIGIPFPDTFYKIINSKTLEEVAYGEEGEICISGPTIMMGYVNNEKETEETLKLHKDKKIWLHTGDVGSMDKDGFVYFKQRLKRIIISNGYNIYPSYVENVINEYPDVETSVVIGIDHAVKIQVAKAIIVLKPGIDPNIEIKKNIRDHCKKYLAKYSMPYEYEFRDSIPKTLVGKVAYKQLEDEEKIKKG